jgi:hypothetical protein
MVKYRAMRVPDWRRKLRRECYAEARKQHRRLLTGLYFGGFFAGGFVGALASCLPSSPDLPLKIFAFMGFGGVLLGHLFIVRPVAQRLLRERMGLCINCGYDIRASSERCPECGQVLPRPIY